MNLLNDMFADDAAMMCGSDLGESIDYRRADNSVLIFSAIVNRRPFEQMTIAQGVAVRQFQVTIPRSADATIGLATRPAAGEQVELALEDGGEEKICMAVERVITEDAGGWDVMLV